MRKITARIVHFFIESKVIDETDQEIYEYGLEILSENVMLTVFLLLFGVMIGKGIETCIFLFSFCWLRRFCGGYHAKMLMYGKEASNRKQEIDRQHHTIPNKRTKDKHYGNVHNRLWNHG